MNPDAITREQADVWLLAQELIERGPSAVDASARLGVSAGQGGTLTDWAIDYRRQLPESEIGAALIELAHIGTVPHGRHHLAAYFLRRFYRRVHERRLFDRGATILARM